MANALKFDGTPNPTSETTGTAFTPRSVFIKFKIDAGQSARNQLFGTKKLSDFMYMHWNGGAISVGYENSARNVGFIGNDIICTTLVEFGETGSGYGIKRVTLNGLVENVNVVKNLQWMNQIQLGYSLRDNNYPLNGFIYDLRISSQLLDLTEQQAIDITSGAVDIDTILPNSSCEIAYNQFTADEATTIINKGSLTGEYNLTVNGGITIQSPIAGSSGPAIEIVSTTLTKISDKLTKDVCQFDFKCTNERIVEYEVRAVKDGGSIGRGMGLLVGSGLTTIEANVNETVTIDDEELTSGDGNYTISVYAKNESGEWNE